MLLLNRSCGGRCLSVEYTDKVGQLARKHNLKLHIDGARIFNAATVSKNFRKYNTEHAIVVAKSSMQMLKACRCTVALEIFFSPSV